MKGTSKAAAAAAAVLLSAGMMSLHAGAASTIEDVYAALREIGAPDGFIQSLQNQYDQSEHDEFGMMITYQDKTVYQTYEVLAENIYIFEDDIDAYLESHVFPPSTQAFTRTIWERATTASTERPFSELSLAEQQNYVSSLTEGDRAAFLSSLSAAQRKSILKQLSPSDKSVVLDIITEMGETIGAYVTIDSIEGNNINYSVRDGSGELIDSAVLGSRVDDTGWDLTVPVLGSAAAIVLALFGMTANLRAAAKREG